MKKSPSERYLLTVRFGKRNIHGLHIYSEAEAVMAKQRLVNAGAKPSHIRIDTYESIFEGNDCDCYEAKVI